MKRASSNRASAAAWTIAAACTMGATSAAGQGLDDAPRAADAGAPADAATTGGASAEPSGSSADGPRAISSSSEGSSRPATAASVTVGGYVEALWQYNFNRPYNGETVARGFDTRHNTITLSNVVIDASWTVRQRVSGRIALQVGHTPNVYYSSEPVVRSPSGEIAFGTGPDVWKYLQQAWVAYLAPIGRGLLFEAGLFLSPIGPEGMAVKDQWNWSRSNLFYGLPFYHTGLRATYALTDRMNLSLAGYNGWNSVVDNNDEKSLSLQWTYNVEDRVTASVLYFSGVERSFGAAGGRGWRHLFDAYVAWNPTSWLGVIAHGDAGFEPVWDGEAAGTTREWRGLQWWAAGAVYARVKPVRWLYLAARGDVLIESLSDAPATGPRPQVIFFSSDRVAANRVASFTATADVRPHENISVRAEFRHDNADQPLYFDSQNVGAPSPTLGRTNTQNTLTFGVTAWY